MANLWRCFHTALNACNDIATICFLCYRRCMVKDCDIKIHLSDPMARRRCQQWLRDSIDRVGITQAELGRRVGLDRDQVNRLLNGKRRWDADTLEGIARTLRVPPPDIGATA